MASEYLGGPDYGQYPKGLIKINNLKLLGFFLNWPVLGCVTANLRYIHTEVFCGNTSAVARVTKLLASRSIPAS